jgi:hypothetical protein
LAKRYGINPKTVAKWRKRTSVADLPTSPKKPHSTVLLPEEEAVIVAFRRYTLLPLDDCLYALQPTIPHLTRSSLHRCLQRHGIGRLPDGRQAGEEEFQELSPLLQCKGQVGVKTSRFSALHQATDVGCQRRWDSRPVGRGNFRPVAAFVEAARRSSNGSASPDYFANNRRSV